MEVETGSSDAWAKAVTPCSPLKGLAIVTTTHEYAAELATTIPGDMSYVVASGPELARSSEALRMLVDRLATSKLSSG
jgi:hypothetical protein